MSSQSLAINSEQFVVARLRHKDLTQIMQIEQESYARPWTAELILAELDNSHGFHFGLYLKDILRAQIFSHLVHDELHILNIAVAPSDRRVGFAKYLMTNVLELLTTSNLRKVYLEVRASNNYAIKLYQGLGFESEGIRKAYYQDNREDALLLSKLLNSNSKY